MNDPEPIQINDPDLAKIIADYAAVDEGGGSDEEEKGDEE